MPEEETLDDKLINKYHTLVKDIQNIPKAQSSKTLLDLLNEEAQRFYLDNRDKEKGSLKFKDDNQKRELAFNIWDKAADHVAKTYLKMSDEQIKGMKALGNDPDGNNIWETFIKSHLGSGREDFFNALDSIEEIDPQTIYKHLVEPLYKSHIAIRTSKRTEKDIKGIGDAQDVLKYLKMAKYHLPDIFKGYKVPSKLKSADQVAQHFLDLVPSLPSTYHPNKKDTHQRDYK